MRLKALPGQRRLLRGFQFSPGAAQLTRQAGICSQLLFTQEPGKVLRIAGVECFGETVGPLQHPSEISTHVVAELGAYRAHDGAVVVIDIDCSPRCRRQAVTNRKKVVHDLFRIRFRQLSVHAPTPAALDRARCLDGTAQRAANNAAERRRHADVLQAFGQAVRQAGVFAPLLHERLHGCLRRPGDKRLTPGRCQNLAGDRAGTTGPKAKRQRQQRDGILQRAADAAGDAGTETGPVLAGGGQKLIMLGRLPGFFPGGLFDAVQAERRQEIGLIRMLLNDLANALFLELEGITTHGIPVHRRRLCVQARIFQLDAGCLPNALDRLVKGFGLCQQTGVEIVDIKRGLTCRSGNCRKARLPS